MDNTPKYSEFYFEHSHNILQKFLSLSIFRNSCDHNEWKIVLRRQNVTFSFICTFKHIIPRLSNIKRLDKTLRVIFYCSQHTTRPENKTQVIQLSTCVFDSSPQNGSSSYTGKLAMNCTTVLILKS